MISFGFVSTRFQLVIAVSILKLDVEISIVGLSIVVSIAIEEIGFDHGCTAIRCFNL